MTERDEPRPDLDALVAALLETDALTPNHDGTPEYYIVDAENVGYLVRTVLALAVPGSVASDEGLRAEVERLRDVADFLASERLMGSAEEVRVGAARIDALTTQRDALQRQVDAVKALADQWEALGITSVYESSLELAGMLRAALSAEADD